MKYTYIMVNVGAAEKYYKAICINPDKFKDVILYLGDFHICGKFLSNSKFEEILYQISNVFSGCNKSSLIREVFTRYTEEFTNIVCIGVSSLPPPQKHPLPLFCRAPLKSENCPSPTFQAIPPYILVFCAPLHHQIFL